MRNLPRAILVILALGLVTPAFSATDAAPTSQPAVTAPAAPGGVAAPTPATETTPAAKTPEKAADEATAPETQAWWKAITVFLIEVSTALALPILIVLALVANRKWKLGLERETIEWAVTKAVGYGEQKAKVALKAGKPMDGPAILEAALSHGTELLVTKGLVSKWGDKLANLVEAKLGEQEAAKVLAAAAQPPKTEG